MKIARIEPIAVSLPMRKPVVMAGEEVRQADNMLVRLAADTGEVGWGEAASAPVMTGETVAGMVAAVRHLAPALIDREAADIAGACAAMERRMHGNHGAKAAIEIALHDLVGRATLRPVHALLGERRRGRLAALAVLGSGDLDGDLYEAAQKKAEGFAIFKIKVGIDAPAYDAERTRRICQALGSRCLISADANQGFGIADAIAFVEAVADAGLAFLEQPVAADDLAGMAKVAASTEIAIGADEGIHALCDIERHHALGAARGVSLKAIKLGGMAAVVEAARLCDRLGMQVNVSCKTGESSIACAAALHVAAVIPAIAWGLTLTNGGLAEDITPHPLAVQHGHAAVLDLPGLGIDVDEDRVRHYRIAER
jgi:muconate cycloisomerase